MMLLKTSLRSFFAHKGRMVLSLLAVVLSVAFVSGTLVFSNTATATFDRLFASTASDLTVRQAVDKLAADAHQGGKTRTVPVDTQRKVAAEPGVKAAIGSVFTETATLVNPATNKSVSPTGGAPTLAGNWTDSPRKSVDITSGHAPQGSDQIVLDADTAKKSDLGVGGHLRVVTMTGNYDFTISGIATFRTTNPGAALAFMDTPTSQKVLLGETAYTSIEVFGDGSRTDDQLKTAALADLGSGYEAKTAAEQKDENAKGVGSFLGFMKYAMLGFAAISLLVGGFLIINTFSMLVAQRTREIGLLRAIGGSRRQVNRSVLIEALILGVLGSTLGLGAGLGLAELLIQLMKAVGMNLDASSLEITWTVPVASYLVGILITVLAAWIPARRAGKISPMAALRDHGTPAEAAANRIRAAVGIVVTGIGAAALTGAGSVDSAANGGMLLGVGVVFTLIGFVVLGPLLATGIVRVLGAALPALFGPSGKLAQRNAMRNPRRTGATAAALMIGLALVSGASVVTSSMVSSAKAKVDKSVGADYGINSRGSSFTPAMVDAVRATKGLTAVTEQKSLPARVTGPDGKAAETEVLAVTAATFGENFKLPVVSGNTDTALAGGIAFPEGFATDHNLKVGDSVSIEYAGGRTQSLTVGAVTEKGSLFDGPFTTIETVGKAVPAADLPADESLYGKAAAGADKATVLADLQKSMEQYPQVVVLDQAGYKDLIQQQVNQLLYMVYGLLGLAIVVAVLGVVNTLALSVVERTREIGLLRAIGLSRRQLRRMVRLESVVIALFGAVLGTGLGLGWGITARQVLAGQGLEILTVPTGTIVTILVGSAVVGLLAALVPAFRAARMNILAAIATD
ncbi:MULTISPECIES: ABC transporter permease [Kitasatospora]|uniref:ABC transporter permease n=2 Tax=Kitasatospora TaxID=2063 RepID=A0ABW0VLJ9_9ACTN|nr:FtsX-like permease family protein [Kitasatospora paracochleata]